MRLTISGAGNGYFDSASFPDAIVALTSPGEVALVRFDATLDRAAQQMALDQAGVRLVDWLVGPGYLVIGAPGTARVELPAGVAIDDVIAALSHVGGVVSVEADEVVSVTALSNDTYFTGGTLWGMAGDQSSPANAFGSQAAEAWALGATGTMKTVVGIIDSGVDYRHPELYRNIFINQGEITAALRGALRDIDTDGVITFVDLNNVANAGSVTDFNGNGYIDAGDLLSDPRWENGADTDNNGFVDDLVGWDFVENDNDPMDENRHGTHVAGIIGAEGGNGVGVAGVNWDIEMIPLRFLDETGSGTSSGGISALNYYTSLAIRYGAVQNFVGTNNSYGSTGASSARQAAIEATARADQLFVAAAGNSSININVTPYYPAVVSTRSAVGYEAVISVASITSTGARSSFSNYGNVAVDLGAPGSSIMSTVLDGGYASLSGTSMATPHVLGAAALISSAFPAMTAAQLGAAILSNTTATSSLNGLVVTNGRLDIGKALSTLGFSSYTPLAVQSLALSDTALAMGETLTVTVTFTQPVTGLDLGDFSFDSATGSLSNLLANPGNPRQWTLRFTPGAGVVDATNTIGLLAGGYAGPQSESGPAATSGNFAIDQVAPTVTTFALPSQTLTAGVPATLTVTFGEDVAGLTLADFTWNASVGALTGLARGAGTTWTATFTPTAGVATASSVITLSAASYADLAGNPGPGASTGAFAVITPPDTAGPQVSSIALSRATIANGQTATVTLTFTEAVTGLDLADLTWDTGVGTVTNLVANPGNAAVWTATYTPLAGASDATNTIAVNSLSYADVAGNPGGGGTSANFAVDTLAPAITAFTLSPASLGPGATATMSVTFSEPVSGLALSDFTWNAAVGALTGFAQVGSTNEWRATFTPLSGLAATTTSVSLTGGSYADLAGNAGPGGSTAPIAVNTVSATGPVIRGTSTSNTLVGTSANETFYGFQANDAARGRGTVDTMTGGGGNDRFVLGDAQGLFYNDNVSNSAGTGDYGVVTDFSAGDQILLASGIRYLLRTESGTGTAIIADLDRSGTYTFFDEAIGLVLNRLPGSFTATSQVIDNVTYTVLG